MIRLTVRDKSGNVQTHIFDCDEVAVGRLSQNDLVLPRSNISKRHAKIVLRGDSFMVIDLRSTNGTYVNGHRITAPQPVTQSDKVYIGEYLVSVMHEGDQVAPSPPPPPPAHASPPKAPTRPPRSHSTRLPSARSAGKRRTMAMGSMAPDADPLDADALEAAMEEALRAVDEPASEERPGPPSEIGLPEPPQLPDSAELPDAPDAPDLLATPEAPHTLHPPAGGPSGTESDPTLAVDLGPGHAADLLSASSRPSSPGAAAAAPLSSSRDAGEPGAPPVSPSAVGPADLEVLARLYQEAEAATARTRASAGPDGLNWDQLEADVSAVVASFAGSATLPAGRNPETCKQDLLFALGGLGPVEHALLDESVEEIHVHGPSAVMVRRGGRLSTFEHCFYGEQAFEAALWRLYQMVGVDPEHAEPVVRGVLADGSPFVLVGEPLTVGYPLLSVRRSSTLPGGAPPNLDALVADGALSSNQLRNLRSALDRRIGVVVLGADRRARLRLLSALLSAAPEERRAVAVDPASELGCSGPMALLRIDPEGFEHGTVDPYRLLCDLAPDHVVLAEVSPGELAGDAAIAMAVFETSSLLASVRCDDATRFVHRIGLGLSLAHPGLDDRGRAELLAATVGLIVQIRGRERGGGGFEVERISRLEVDKRRVRTVPLND